MEMGNTWMKGFKPYLPTIPRDKSIVALLYNHCSNETMNTFESKDGGPLPYIIQTQIIVTKTVHILVAFVVYF